MSRASASIYWEITVQILGLKTDIRVGHGILPTKVMSNEASMVKISGKCEKQDLIIKSSNEVS
jgi:hypothetical protein